MNSRVKILLGLLVLIVLAWAVIIYRDYFTGETTQTTSHKPGTADEDVAEENYTSPQREAEVSKSMALLKGWAAGERVDEEAVRRFGLEKCFQSEEIDDRLFQRINGKTFVEGGHIRRGDLRHLKVLHVDVEGHTFIGEMICHRMIADKLTEIFRKLYEARYPIEQMLLPDVYGADDERQMQKNNSSCFCDRTVQNSRTLSKHALGLAVDINPRYNPYVVPHRDGSVEISPANGKSYVDRTRNFDYKIEKNDLCYQLFTSNGFQWGGNWSSRKDYQHFEFKP